MPMFLDCHSREGGNLWLTADPRLRGDDNFEWGALPADRQARLAPPVAGVYHSFICLNVTEWNYL